MFLDHGLGNVAHRIEKERLDELVAKLKDRTITPKELEEITNGHLHLAVCVTARYVMYRRSLSLELLAEALYGMFEALLKAPDKLYDLEITPYIVTYMKKYVKKKLNEDGPIRIPDTTRRRKQLRLPTTENDVDQIADPEQSLKQLRETIYASTQSEFEREVIKYRELKLKDQEIAEKLQCSRVKVLQARHRVYERFKKKS